jgi:hypothetical protein
MWGGEKIECGYGWTYVGQDGVDVLLLLCFLQKE